MINYSMKNFSLLLIFASIHLTSPGQSMYSSRIGSKFFPGHLDLVISINEGYLRYELFNHWYTRSFAELRQFAIPLDSLDLYNKSNDTLNFNVDHDKIYLIDKRFNIEKNIKHQKLCSSVDNMRKISFAYKVSRRYEDLHHYDLYKTEDLILDENGFKIKVLENLQKIIKTKH